MKKKILFAAVGICCIVQTVSAMEFGGFEIEMGIGVQESLPKDWEQAAIPQENNWEAEESGEISEQNGMIQGEENVPQDSWAAEGNGNTLPHNWIMEGEENSFQHQSLMEENGSAVQNICLPEETICPSSNPLPVEQPKESRDFPIESMTPTPKLLSPTPEILSPTPVPKEKKTASSSHSSKKEKKISKKGELQVYAGTTVLEKGEKPEIRVISDGTVQVLSFRIAGWECSWQWKGNLLCSGSAPSEKSQILEYVLLYEKGNNIVVKEKK